MSTRGLGDTVVLGMYSAMQCFGAAGGMGWVVCGFQFIGACLGWWCVAVAPSGVSGRSDGVLAGLWFDPDIEATLDVPEQRALIYGTMVVAEILAFRWDSGFVHEVRISRC